MTLNRRIFLTGLSSLALTACGGTGPAVSQSTGLPADLRPQPNAAYDAWVTSFRNRVTGISSNTLSTAFANAGYLPGVVTRDRNQIQTRRTLEDYLSITVSDERVAKGRAAFRRHANTLSAVSARYGVPPEVICAIWGVESQYGEKKGDIPVISATSTLAFDGRRGAFYEQQLVAALRILERGDTTAANLKGSWAGAMGHTQFIPTSYQSFAVDFTGDGRRDIWSNDPTDSLASTAAYLSRNGWRNGLKWGSEEGSGGPSGRTLQPQAGGVRFTVTRNFNVIKTYNNSDFYAIGIGHLSDRIAGGGPLRGSFPPDENGLTKADRIRLQQGLAARGYDVGGIDGVIGRGTTAAIRDFQSQQGLEPTGIPSKALIAML